MSNHSYPPVADQNCINCRHSRPMNRWDQNRVKCCRMAPRPGINDGDYAVWPLVLRDDWCGEWAPRDAGQ
jgi:hypothetical protein